MGKRMIPNTAATRAEAKRHQQEAQDARRGAKEKGVSETTAHSLNQAAKRRENRS